MVNIEQEYQKNLNENKIPDVLLVEVKDCLGNLRSALDYLWVKIPGAGSTGHFPIANSANDFANKTNGIESKYTLPVEKWQGYKGDPWLSVFGRIRNKHEHVTLIPQTRKETKEFSVKAGNGTLVFRGAKFHCGNMAAISIGGIPVKIDENTQFPTETPGVEIDRKTWVDFLFDGRSIDPNFPEGVSVLLFLKQSTDNVVKIISEVENI